MPVLANLSRLAFYPVPKNACTSVKIVLRRAETGEVSDDIEQAHRWQGTPGFEPAPEGYRTFCVVRDPVDRFISGYRNRVGHFGELGEGAVPDDAMRALGLQYDPDIEFFALHLAQYMAVSESIDHHFRPQAYFLGWDLKFYDRVFAWGQFELLSDFLAEATGIESGLPVTQDGGRKISRNEVPDWLPLFLATAYAGDYALLQGYYPPHTARD